MDNTQLLALLVIIGVVANFVGPFAGWLNKFGPSPAPPGQSALTSTATSTGSVQGSCTVNPSLVVTGTDANYGGGAVTLTNYYRFTDTTGKVVYMGSTSPTSVGKVDILSTGTTYIAGIVPTVQMTCGTNPVAVSLAHWANPTVSVYNNAGTATLTNGTAAGQAQSENISSAGGLYNNKIHLVGNNLNTTGTMLAVVDYTNVTSVIQSVSLTSIAGSPAATKIGTPAGYASETSGGYSVAFVIPAINGANTADYNLQSVATSTSKIGGAVRVRLYLLQPFVDIDGTFNSGNTPFDQLNNDKTASKLDFAWYVQ